VTTTPTAEAAGFSGSLRCLKGQPGPEYVVGRILVGMRAVATRQTAEFSLTDTVPGSHVPAPDAPREAGSRHTKGSQPDES
jgi:hypothetical protein